MKTLTCKQMGGTCDFAMSASTPEEMMAEGMKHLEESHPEMANDIKAAPKDDPKMIEWGTTFQKTWEETPDNM